MVSAARMVEFGHLVATERAFVSANSLAFSSGDRVVSNISSSFEGLTIGSIPMARSSDNLLGLCEAKTS